MRTSIVWRLIAKDLYLYRWLIGAALVVGLGSLFIPRTSSEGPNSLMLVLLLTSIVALGIFIGIYGIMNERKEKSLLFVLSLPISPMQYTIAKVAAALIAFLIPWSILTATIIGLSLAFDPPLDGVLPTSITMMLFFLANFCVLISLALIAHTEFWSVVAILATNVSVSLYMTTVPNLPGIREHIAGPVAVWSPTILGVLGVEAAAIVLPLIAMFFVQARKKDFL
jgi:ABC-type transport system involved in multi-copper enzyme maturation permease subunit